MFDSQEAVFYFVGFASVFFILLIIIIIVVAFLYHGRKRLHQLEISNFQSVLLQAQLEIKEQTLQTIGSDLHDNIGQLLSLTNFTLKSIQIDNPEKALEKIEAATTLTSSSIKELRQLGRLLQGQQLIGQGLQHAIEQAIGWLNKSDKLTINYQVNATKDVKLDANKELILFRLFQEVVNNIFKHADASAVQIELSFTSEGVLLNVKDNGIGFNTDLILNEATGMGIYNIHKRANLIGGEANIISKPGHGTEISINVPY